MDNDTVFPAHAGMSRASVDSTAVTQCFPRSRGDEPRRYPPLAAAGQFSPLTRG